MKIDPSTINRRKAGILLAVSSLPSPYGIGTFGEAARDWIGFLEKAKQQWQILPLGHTSWGDSPYMSFSAFAISPYYIDLDELCGQGLLKKEEIDALEWGQGRVDYGLLFKNREPLLRKAFSRFKRLGSLGSMEELNKFCTENTFWLDDYCLFMALKQKNNGKSWLLWEESERFKENVYVKEKLMEDIKYHAFVQWTAWTQWSALKTYAAQKGVSIIGDMPIYVAMDSADVWANPHLFQLDQDRKPKAVAGCPPDAFSAKGQLWGNPLYDWDKMKETGFAWWLNRMQESLSFFDVVRIDHFRGFESYYSIPNNAEDASGGSWKKGPGIDFISALRTLGEEDHKKRIIAEDLGFLTDEVRALLDRSGFPCMKVLQFAFDSREAGCYMPYTYTRNCAVYTGTHDNTTTLGWFRTAYPEDVKLAKDYLGVEDETTGVWAFIRAALSSVADLAVIPMQDYLCLDESARMNTPSSTGANWQWRLPADSPTDALAQKIARLTKINGRCG
ncbi:MAG: 4-alpha-glucanotransferase [Treponema sp.]|jgi:4-alpha-glucanotransferase|nr:4-alpha-glucanotransferase [Treponema sp.]